MSFKPTKVSDFFNHEQVAKLRECVSQNQPVLLVGDSGVGKTSSVYFVAKDLGLPLEELNASDYRRTDSLQKILTLVSVRGFVRKLYLLDEVDGIDSVSSWKLVSRILLETKHPVVLTANSAWRIPDDVKNNCTQLHYQRPPLMVVVTNIRNIATKIGVKPKYENVTDDFRASSNAAIYGGTKHQTSDIFTDVANIFKNGAIPKDIDKNILIWLMDNAVRFYSGRRLFEYLQLLSRIDRMHEEQIVNRWQLLSNFEHATYGNVIYPYYLKRLSVLRGVKKE